MMSLKEQLTVDMKEAMKAREDGKMRLSVIRLVRGAIRQKEIDGKCELGDDDVLAIIKGSRADLVEAAEQEIGILMSYLPKQLGEDEVRALVEEAVKATGAETAKDMGKVMKELMPKVKGKADGKMVNNIVREFLE